MGGNADGHAGAILASARPGHRDNNGGRQPPPPTVPSMQHAVDVGDPQRIAQEYNAVQEGGRA